MTKIEKQLETARIDLDALNQRLAALDAENGASVVSWPRVMNTDWCYSFESARSSAAVRPSR